MKNIFSLVTLLSAGLLYGQLNTEVYLCTISTTDSILQLSKPTNISNNEGYDNQPSFYSDNTVLFASTRNGQTDIASYQIDEKKLHWITDTPIGSEYSPLKIPSKEEISAIRLDTTGLQRLYGYDSATGQSRVLLKDLKVGYHLWYSKDILVATVLVENRMDLVVSNFKEGTTHTMQKNVGRSLHKIPNTDLISYISKETDTWSIKSLQPISGATKELTTLFSPIEDMCWLADGTILIPYGKYIAKFKYDVDKQWGIFWQFNEEEVNNISRLKVSDSGNILALVAEVSPRIIVQKQVDSFNNENLDAFVNCYAADVLVQNFPADSLYTGRETMKENYGRFFANNPRTQVEVKKRIVYNNSVIDEEKVTQAGKVNWQAAIYKVRNGLIQSMAFIHGKRNNAAVEAVVQKQLEAYNNRDIDAFLETYSEDVQVFRYPNKLDYEGKEKMRAQYEGFFKQAKGLHCEIKQRIVIANKVIDEEYITVNGANGSSAVAIYEVNKGKISKVTFVD